MPKQFKLKADEIKPIAKGFGACFASDKITVDGHPVRFMYREKPDRDVDSGWRFFSGLETDDYMDAPNNHAIYDVNTIANYDTSIIPFLSSPIGGVFEKPHDRLAFIPVTDWAPPENENDHSHSMVLTNRSTRTLPL